MSKSCGNLKGTSTVIDVWSFPMPEDPGEGGTPNHLGVEVPDVDTGARR
jgi:hypothetical protein